MENGMSVDFRTKQRRMGEMAEFLFENTIRISKSNGREALHFFVIADRGAQQLVGIMRDLFVVN